MAYPEIHSPHSAFQLPPQEDFEVADENSQQLLEIEEDRRSGSDRRSESIVVPVDFRRRERRDISTQDGDTIWISPDHLLALEDDRPADIFDPVTAFDKPKKAPETTEKTEGVPQQVTTPSLLDQARRLVGKVYFKKGYVTADELTPEGYLDATVDPHTADSTYFVALHGDQVGATSRLIEKSELKDFPAVSDFEISQEVLDTLDQNAELYDEVSALAKDKGIGHPNDVPLIYAQMMKHTINRGGRYWLMSVDTHFYNRSLSHLFGAKSFKKLGEPRDYMGSETAPMLLDTYKALQLFNKRFVPKHIKDCFRRGLAGLDTSVLDEKTQRILKKHGINQDEEEWQRNRRISRFANAGMLGLVGYVTARAAVIPATSLSSEGVNTGVFFALDIGTVPPYAKGLEWYARNDSSRTKKIGGAAMAGAGFIAPYAYAAYEAGATGPMIEAGGIWAAALVAIPGIKKVLKTVKARRNRGETETSEATSEAVETPQLVEERASVQGVKKAAWFRRNRKSAIPTQVTGAESLDSAALPEEA